MKNGWEYYETADSGVHFAIRDYGPRSARLRFVRCAVLSGDSREDLMLGRGTLDGKFRTLREARQHVRERIAVLEGQRQ